MSLSNAIVRSGVLAMLGLALQRDLFQLVQRSGTKMLEAGGMGLVLDVATLLR